MDMQTAQTPATFQLHIGTYSGVLLGLQGSTTKLRTMYAYQTNIGIIKCIKLFGKFLITGGYDEILRIYNINKKREVGQLTGHTGTITCLDHFKRTIFSGADDGSIKIWRTKDWSLLFSLNGHDKAVTAMNLHPSGKILFSYGKDRKLIIWNLVTGKKVFRKGFKFGIHFFLLLLLLLLHPLTSSRCRQNRINREQLQSPSHERQKRSPN